MHVDQEVTVSLKKWIRTRNRTDTLLLGWLLGASAASLLHDAEPANKSILIWTVVAGFVVAVIWVSAWGLSMVRRNFRRFP